MEIKVKVATILLQKANPPLDSSDFEFSLKEGSTVAELIEALHIPEKFVGTVTVNKRKVGQDHVLGHGDLVAILPAISGG